MVTIIAMTDCGRSRTRFAARMPEAAPRSVRKSPRPLSRAKRTWGSLRKIQDRRGDPLRAHPREALERFLMDGRIEIDSISSSVQSGPRRCLIHYAAPFQMAENRDFWSWLVTRHGPLREIAALTVGFSRSAARI